MYKNRKTIIYIKLTNNLNFKNNKLNASTKIYCYTTYLKIINSFKKIQSKNRYATPVEQFKLVDLSISSQFL